MFPSYLLDYIIHYILGMQKSNEGSNNLLEVTAAVLSEERLQMLLVSAQETNLALCIKYAMKEYCIILIDLSVMCHTGIWWDKISTM